MMSEEVTVKSSPVAKLKATSDGSFEVELKSGDETKTIHATKPEFPLKVDKNGLVFIDRGKNTRIVNEKAYSNAIASAYKNKEFCKIQEKVAHL